MSNIANFAIIGYGKMGKLYDETIQADYIIDLFPVKRRVYFRSLEEFLFYKPQVDLVIVSSSADTHFPIAYQLLRNGYHVLVEKPICLSSEEAHILENLAEKRQKILYQSTLERYNPLIIFLKNGVSFSQVARIKSQRFGPRPDRTYVEDPVFDLGIHDVDLYFYLGRKPVPWEITVGYTDRPTREILLYTKSGKKIIFDLLNKFVRSDAINMDFSQSMVNNPILQMVREILYKGPSINEKWSEEIKLLERFSENKISLTAVDDIITS